MWTHAARSALNGTKVSQDGDEMVRVDQGPGFIINDETAKDQTTAELLKSAAAVAADAKPIMIARERDLSRLCIL